MTRVSLEEGTFLTIGLHKLNLEKSRTVSVVSARNFKFLGFALGKGRNGYFIRVHAKSVKKARQMVHTERANGAGSPPRWCMGTRPLYNEFSIGRCNSF